MARARLRTSAPSSRRKQRRGANESSEARPERTESRKRILALARADFVQARRLAFCWSAAGSTEVRDHRGAPHFELGFPGRCWGLVRTSSQSGLPGEGLAL